MRNCDESVKINHRQNWPHVPDHPYRILIIGNSRSGKTNVLWNLLKHQWPDIVKFYWYVKDSVESKYQLLISGREEAGNKKPKISKSINW